MCKKGTYAPVINLSTFTHTEAIRKGLHSSEIALFASLIIFVLKQFRKVHVKIYLSNGNMQNFVKPTINYKKQLSGRALTPNPYRICKDYVGFQLKSSAKVVLISQCDF